MALGVPLVQLTWLLSSVVTLPRWSFWLLVAVLLTLDVIGAVTEGRHVVIGNGNGGIVHPKMMQAHPEILRAIQHAQDLAASLVGISIVVVTKDGNSAKITSMPDDVNVIEKAIAQHLTALLSLTGALGNMSRQVQEQAPPVGKILRPPPIMGG